MVWKDYGVIFHSIHKKNWIHSHSYVPTAIVLKDRIRIFVAFWDKYQIGRIGYIDVDIYNPEHVIGYSKSPALDVGVNNQFDEHGVTPLSIVHDGYNYRLYYVGWKKLKNKKHRYTLFMGLALSQDAISFKRYQYNPIIGPTKSNAYCRAGGYFLKQKNYWQCWYAEYQDLVHINNKYVPQYDLCYMISEDGINWPDTSTTIFKSGINKIFGYGRSSIWQEKSIWNALFVKRHINKGYYDFEYAMSHNGINWLPQKNQLYNFDSSYTLDDQSSISFPNIINIQQQKYLFYNGNNFGQDGLRLAIWND